MNIEKIYRYRGHDELIDLGSTLGIQVPSNGRSVVPLQTIISAYAEADAERYATAIEQMEVEYGQVGMTKRRERIVEKRKWGQSEVHFIEYWYDSYTWWQPIKVDGKRIDGI
jgi:hypothetical protein